MSPADGPLGFDEDDEEPLRRAPAPAPSAPAPAPARREPGRGGRGGLRRPGPGGWVLGVAVVAILGLILLNTIRTTGPGSRGLAAGDVAPAFAAPLASSRLAATNDVNVATRAGAGSAGDVPACSVRRPDVVTSCALWGRGPAVLAFFATRSSGCVRELDALDDVARRHPSVRVLGVSIRGDLGTVRRLGRRWSFPVAYDRDGVLANLYAVAVCPQLTFLARGGRAAGPSALGAVGSAELERRFAALEG